MGFDDRGNRLGSGGARVSAQAVGTKEKVAARITDNHDGTYTGHYTPKHFGEYELTMSVNGDAVAGSPFSVTVEPLDVSPPHCTASGEGIHKAEASSETDFEVQTRTKHGRAQNLRSLGDLSTVFRLVSPALR